MWMHLPEPCILKWGLSLHFWLVGFTKTGLYKNLISTLNKLTHIKAPIYSSKYCDTNLSSIKNNWSFFTSLLLIIFGRKYTFFFFFCSLTFCHYFYIWAVLVLIAYQLKLLSVLSLLPSPVLFTSICLHLMWLLFHKTLKDLLRFPVRDFVKQEGKKHDLWLMKKKVLNCTIHRYHM